MSNIFEQWDNASNLQSIQADLANNSSSNSDNEFKEVPHGKYEVAVVKMEIKATKKLPARPMVSVWMRIVSEGEYKGSMIFMNQLITQGFQLQIVNDFLHSLTKGLDNPIPIEFHSYAQYSDLLDTVMDAITDRYEYALNYTVNKRGYNQYFINEVFALD